MVVAPDPDTKRMTEAEFIDGVLLGYELNGKWHQGFIQDASDRLEDARRAYYQSLTIGELEAEAEQLTLSFAVLYQEVQAGVWDDDAELIIGRGYDLELEAILTECERRKQALDEFGKPAYQAPRQFDGAFAQSLKERVDGDVLAEFVVRYHPGTGLKKQGNRYVGLCPFHMERSPSFTIYPNGHWSCFGCKVGGDIFSFVRELGTSWAEAVRIVAAYLGVDMPKPVIPTSGPTPIWQAYSA